LHEVRVEPLEPERLWALIGDERATRFKAAAASTRELLGDRQVLNVNSTAAGGGVAEMLETLLAYARGLGINARWLVIRGTPPFFEITKRIHNHLYGAPGDGGPLASAQRSVYERTMRDNADDLVALVRPGDLVILHDPQPAGLAPAIKDAGGVLIWRCHVGVDTQNGWTEAGWSFLREYLDVMDDFVFTRRAFAPPWMDEERLWVIPPSIDPFSSKNRELSSAEVHDVLAHVGLIAGEVSGPVTYTRRDGSFTRIKRYADILQTGPSPPPEAPLVVQVSRWDRMKDMVGVIRGFVEHVDGTEGAHLLLAGPAVTGVTDDPEGGQVLDECMQVWREIPHDARARVHLACLPMQDPEENATIVNALQRHAAVVVQKSLAEGFGLTVVEAMWKGRPVVASRVGGIPDQIVDGADGLLIDPHDLVAFGAAVRRVLEEPAWGATLGARARARAHEQFLGDRHLQQWGAVFGHRKGP
jgi:trehalose synthase